RIARGVNSAGEPLAHASLVGMLLAFDACHERRDALRHARRYEWLEGGAGFVELPRLDGRCSDRDGAFHRVGAERRQLAHAVEAIARAVANARVGVGRSEIGMWRAAPRALQDLGGAGSVPARGQKTPGDGGGRYQVGREAMRLQGQVQGALRIVFLGGLSLRGEQNGAAAISLCALDMSVLASDSD